MAREMQNILHRLVSSPKKRVSIFRESPVNIQGFILLNLSRRFRDDILNELEEEEILKLLHYLDPDKATDLLRCVDKHRREKITKELSEDKREKVEFLLRFNPKTAAGIMSLDYVEVSKKATFGEVSKLIQKHEKRTGKVPTILVVENGFFIGEVPGHVIVTRKGKDRIGKYIRRVPKIKYDLDENEVIRVFKTHEHNKIIVLDDDGSVLGVIYSDDILRLLQKKSASNLYGFAGVREEEDVLDSALMKVKNRYKWLIINLATAFLAASVVGLFQKTISAFVLLAVYMPIVAGMGGNAGTQTLAVVVRGLTLREVELKTGKKVIVNEMLAGAVNGVVNGVLVAAVAVLWNKTPLLGLIVGIAMVVNLIIAGFFGTVIPLLMKRLGKDPASSATVFITTATDVLGFFVFLGLASLVL